MEAESDNKKYTPTKEELEKLEDELRKLNEQKFGNLKSEPIIEELTDWDETLMDGIEEENNLGDEGVKRLSYLRSHG
jgi:hypothetical protein